MKPSSPLRSSLPRRCREEHPRKKLLKDSPLATVIGLPANLFYSTGIPVPSSC